jgi:leucyl-tRNA synthetase
MWQLLGHKPAVALAGFAEPIASLLVRDSLTAVVQVDGKLRDKFEVSASITEAELEALAMASVNVQNALAGKQIKNVIVRAPKLVNIATA